MRCYFVICGSTNLTRPWLDRKSTRLNSSHLVISYAVFCLKKKKLLPTRRRSISLIRPTSPDMPSPDIRVPDYRAPRGHGYRHLPSRVNGASGVGYLDACV